MSGRGLAFPSVFLSIAADQQHLLRFSGDSDESGGFWDDYWLTESLLHDGDSFFRWGGVRKTTVNRVVENCE
ncbi:hypothetical protein L2E82_33393 [Cichorium intybus]|uniref:Uncharacterized protein n=1 Tax=Cichorium intybus TaxID=13427 RepID=A0ACB9BK12_CICIN|nr:hypothetical protein L2E82_33393 [Cichorium intybus]